MVMLEYLRLTDQMLKKEESDEVKRVFIFGLVFAFSLGARSFSMAEDAGAEGITRTEDSVKGGNFL